jgi:hypothetical protein
LGKTKEERIAKKKQLFEQFEEFKKQKELELMGFTEKKVEEKESKRKKMKEYAAQRLKLGFNNKGKEEVEDKVLETLWKNEKQYKT